jgi:hypothetical protein
MDNLVDDSLWLTRGELFIDIEWRSGPFMVADATGDERPQEE